MWLELASLVLSAAAFAVSVAAMSRVARGGPKIWTGEEPRPPLRPIYRTPDDAEVVAAKNSGSRLTFGR